MSSYAKAEGNNHGSGFNTHDSNGNLHKPFTPVVKKRLSKKPYEVSIREQPVTIRRMPYVPVEDSLLVDAGTARANIAASAEKPNGTTEGDWAEKHKHQTVLEQHVSYFDPDGDGIFSPLDTYHGIRAWGFNVIFASVFAFLIHLGISYPTCPSIIPDLRLRIYVKNIHKTKHGSDSQTYDNEGRFKPQQFEDFFSKYDKAGKGGLDIWDILAALKGQRLLRDSFGSTANFAEWIVTYLLLWPEDGICRKEDVRGIFDGSMFQKKADEYQEKKRRMKKQGMKAGLKVDGKGQRHSV
ncbi:MAG: hypothetical protein M1820_003950 [Bogoriella megaspora]|nr:MAG: hypothetical protein M1820_003950 [Bogoriella megaspora]